MQSRSARRLHPPFATGDMPMQLHAARHSTSSTPFFAGLGAVLVVMLGSGLLAGCSDKEGSVLEDSSAGSGSTNNSPAPSLPGTGAAGSNSTVTVVGSGNSSSASAAGSIGASATSTTAGAGQSGASGSKADADWGPVRIAGAGTGAGGGAAVAAGGGAGLPSTATGGSSSGLASCGGLEAFKTCATSQIPAHRRTAQVLLVMDKSGSMVNQPAGYDAPLWPSLASALGAALDETKTEIHSGLLLYPKAGTAKDCVKPEECCTLGSGSTWVDVPIASGDVSVPAIKQAFTATTPGGGTPISKALERALAYFTAEGERLPGDHYVLLATDGGPNCNETLNCRAAMNQCTANIDQNKLSSTDPNLCETQPAACLDNEAVLQHIQALAQAGIQTIVVGIPGSESYANYLDSFAEAGGRPVATGSHRYYEVPSSGGLTALTDTFRSITVDLVKTCEIELASAPPSLDKINVSIDCQVVPSAGADGWMLSEDYKKITFLGATCERMKTKGAQRVDVVMGCPTLM